MASPSPTGTATSTQRVPLVSPYPGIGTIRPFNSAVGKDIPSYADGTRMYSETNWVLNMSSFGTDDSTAEWAARVKAHWALADLGGPKWKANHPGVQGVWGDNFIWYGPYFEANRSPGGAPPGMTGRTVGRRGHPQFHEAPLDPRPRHAPRRERRRKRVRLR